MSYVRIDNNWNYKKIANYQDMIPLRWHFSLFSIIKWKFLLCTLEQNLLNKSYCRCFENKIGSCDLFVKQNLGSNIFNRNGNFLYNSLIFKVQAYPRILISGFDITDMELDISYKSFSLCFTGKA